MFESPYMEWDTAHNQIPGAARTSSSSRFASMSDAGPAKLVGSRQAAGLCPPGPRAVKLDGLWERAVEPALAFETDIQFRAPSAGLEYEPSYVPQNYGIEPGLDQYFGPVWYRRMVRRPAKAEYVDLCFDAVDYIADVALDGVWLGRHEGYFAPFHFDLSDRLIPEGSELVVRVQDPLEDPLDVGSLFPYRRYIKGVLNHHDSRPMFTFDTDAKKSQYRPTGGIVGSVELRPTGSVRLDAAFFTPLDTRGNLHVCFALSNRTHDELSAVIRVDLAGSGITPIAPVELHVTIPAGDSRLDLETAIPDPVLWYDHAFSDVGGPHLYDAKVTVIVAGVVSDQRLERFGLRTAAFMEGSKFQYRLNGLSTHIRAANYIPIEHWAGLRTDFYERDFGLLKAANCHSVVIHAHVQSPSCYAAADAAGVSIFQDFPLQWAYQAGPELDGAFLPTACEMAAEMVYLLWNHPSVVYWCAHNEPPHQVLLTLNASKLREAFGHSPTWEEFRNAPASIHYLPPIEGLGVGADYGNYYLDTALRDTIAHIDPLRFVNRESGQGVDYHEYSGTLTGGSIYDTGKHRPAPFVSEFGDFPVDRTAVKDERIRGLGWPVKEAELIEMCRGSLPNIVRAMVGPLDRYPNLAAATYAMERRAAFTAKYMTEYYRTHPESYTGHRWHFLVNHWGRAGAGLLDVERTPTFAYDAYGAANRARLAACHLTSSVFHPGEVTCPIYAVNDLQSQWSGEIDWRLAMVAEVEIIHTGTPVNSDTQSVLADWIGPQIGVYVMGTGVKGEILASGRIQVEVPRGSCHKVEELVLDTSEVGAYCLELSWEGESNEYTYLVDLPHWRPELGFSRRIY